ncbi:MAG TPA: alpha-2-macroglobulin family protein, partial [Aliiroseovarius sp.]|nr:alpha-2-macroglobulin family protein [Aliiroseovarius sp.]
CNAFTFNGNKNACFLKSGAGAQTEFSGAFSAQILPTSPLALAFSGARQADLNFLHESDFAAARAQASDLPHNFVVGGWDLQALRDGVRDSESQANLLSAMKYAGGVVVQTDAAADWIEFSRLSLALQSSSSSDQRRYRTQGILAAINGYVRSNNPPQQANALNLLADGLISRRRGRDAIPALRLSMTLSPRDDTEAKLDDAIAKYGFRVSEHRVDANSTNPRICAVFNEPLVAAGVDYAPYVQTDASGLAVETSGRELCLSGVSHGARYRVTLRPGLPAASGEELVKPVVLNLYVRDRDPSVIFPGRAYVLPRTADAGLPITAVNVSEIDLTLSRISDRNMVRAFQERYFGRPLSPWELEGFSASLAEQVWQGTGEVQTELNRDVTTRLPIGQAIADQPPGIYVLQAAVPGADPYDTPPATQWFVISDIGLATMLGADGLHVFTRSLASAEPMAGAQVQLISRANAVLGEATSDANGYAQFPSGLTAGLNGAAPALVVVRSGNDDIAFLSLTEPEFDLSDRGVEGRPPAPPIDLFATTDRGAYRAGEVVHVTALARDAVASGIENLPVTAILTRPDGVEYSRTLSNGSGAGGHVFDLPLGGNVPRGTWRLDLHADPDAPALVSRTLLVEDFLPERIDFDLSLPDGALRVTDTPTLTINARYLFGADGADLPVEGDVVVRPARVVEGYPGYLFGRYDSEISAEWGTLQSGQRTDASGQAALQVEFPEISAPGRPLEATITVRVSEGSGRPVERNLTRLLTPDSAMIGIKPAFDDDLPEGSEARFSLIALSPEMAPTTMNVRWSLNKIRTRYQWYSLDGRWNWDPVISRTLIASGDTLLDGAPLQIAAPVDWGQYELVVESLGAGAGLSSAVEFYAGWYGAADASVTPDMLEVSLDAERYRPGDTARLRMVPRVPGKVLVTVMSNRLIDMIPVDVTAGENIVDIPVTDEWGAGAYVTATLIQPMDDAGGHLPTRALGLTHASVDPGQRQLTATLEASDEATPRGPLDVALRVAGGVPGEQVYATISAVDLGILNLTSFKSPDASDHYFGQRRLGMGLRDIYGRLIDGRDGVLGALRSGGDAAAELRMQAPPPTEELVAQFSGLLTIGADGLARASFDLPEFNGTVRLMAVVWSATGVGEAEKDVLVRDPVVMTASLPRFMAPGDSARLLLELVHAKGPAGDVQLSVVGRGVSIDTSAIPEVLTLAQGGTARLSIPVTAVQAGVQKIELALTTPAGQRLTKVLMLPVQSNGPEVVRVSRFDLPAGGTFRLENNVFAGFVPGTGRATLTAGALARINAPALLERLDRYPYGCTEQTTSRALPLLYFGNVAEAMGLADRIGIPARINDAIDRVLSNQTASGSFGLWRPSSGDLWLDAYVSDFLSRARAQGYDVPDVAFRSAMDNLRNQVNYTPDFDSGGEDIAYALYVLAREGAASMGDLRYYVDEKGSAFSSALAAAQMGAALASYGDPTRADQMFTRAARKLVRFQPETTQIWRDDYGTNLRDAAAVLTLAIEAGTDVINRDALALRVAKGNTYLSTQEATWSLLATNALITDNLDQGLMVNGVALTGPLIEVLDAEAVVGASEIANTGADATELTLTTFGVASVPEPAGGQGYAIERQYFTLDGLPFDLTDVAQGTRLVTVLTIRPFGPSAGRLMVNDPLPAGFEIDNPTLLSSGDINALDWLDLGVVPENTEFRQERFLAAVDWESDKTFRLAYVVRAITPGDFLHPAASVEDMYRPTFRAHSDTGRVRISE